MNQEISIPPEKVDALYERLDREAEASGYHLNPDHEFAWDLVEGLLINEERYGYWACPCRLVDGDKQKDLDIICSCDYRDADLLDWGACYCALYVSDEARPELVEGCCGANGNSNPSQSAGHRRASVHRSFPLLRPPVPVRNLPFLCGAVGFAATSALVSVRLASAPSARPNRNASSGSGEVAQSPREDNGWQARNKEGEKP